MITINDDDVQKPLRPLLYRNVPFYNFDNVTSSVDDI